MFWNVWLVDESLGLGGWELVAEGFATEAEASLFAAQQQEKLDEGTSLYYMEMEAA